MQITLSGTPKEFAAFDFSSLGRAAVAAPGESVMPAAKVKPAKAPEPAALESPGETNSVEQLEPFNYTETTEKEAEPEAKQSAPAEAKAPTREDVRAAVVAAVQAGKRAQISDLLQKFGVPNASTLAESQLVEFMAKLEPVLVEASDPRKPCTARIFTS